MWLRYQFSIEICPFCFFCYFILQMLISMHHVHLFLSVSKFQLILKHQLSIRFLLHSPLHIFFILALLFCFVISNLLNSYLIDFLYLFWTETFEMIWNIPMIRKLALSGIWIFCHNIAVVSHCNFKLIFPFLILSPILFFVFLCLCYSFVLFL